MSNINNFTDLKAWEESHSLVIMLYRVTKGYPKDEIFGITNQMRRAAVSITSNIAEGFGRQTYREKAQFYSVAFGSLTELQNQLMISRDVGYMSTKEYGEFEDQYLICQKLICGLIKSTKLKIL